MTEAFLSQCSEYSGQPVLYRLPVKVSRQESFARSFRTVLQEKSGEPDRPIIILQSLRKYDMILLKVRIT